MLLMCHKWPTPVYEYQGQGTAGFHGPSTLAGVWILSLWKNHRLTAQSWNRRSANTGARSSKLLLYCTGYGTGWLALLFQRRTGLHPKSMLDLDHDGVQLPNSPGDKIVRRAIFSWCVMKGHSRCAAGVRSAEIENSRKKLFQVLWLSCHQQWNSRAINAETRLRIGNHH